MMLATVKLLFTHYYYNEIIITEIIIHLFIIIISNTEGPGEIQAENDKVRKAAQLEKKILKGVKHLIWKLIPSQDILNKI